MIRDDMRDALALIGTAIDGDSEGSRVIREHADNEGLIDALVTANVHALRLLAQHDRVPLSRAADQMREVLRTL